MASYGPEPASSHALNLPELLQGISQYLSASETAASARVCKSWHGSLQPLVFRDVHISFERSQDKTLKPSKRNPPVKVLRKNSKSIRSITVIGRPSGRGRIEYFSLRKCTALERLVWKSNEEAFNPVPNCQWNSVIDFILANRSRLRHITIEYHHATSTRFWEALARNPIPSLKSLSIKNYGFDDGSAPHLWKVCRFVDSLSLELGNCWGLAQYLAAICDDPNAAARKLQEEIDDELQEEQGGESVETIDRCLGQRHSIDVGDQYNSDENFLFPRAKSLRLPSLGDLIEGEEWLDLMKQCPKLETIRCGVNYPWASGSARGLCEALSSKSVWPNLNSMSFQFTNITDETLAETILSLNQDHTDQHSTFSDRPSRPLKSLEVLGNSFGRASMDALRYHHHLESLEDLYLVSEGFTSIDVLTILTSCPRLKSFNAPMLDAAEVVRARDRPWVCLDLEIWVADILIVSEDNTPPSPTSKASTTPQEAEMQEACLEQLGRLHKLKVLKIHERSNVSEVQTISLVLSKGLERLAGLRLLEEVSFGGIQPEDEDRNWVTAHWKNLKKVMYEGDDAMYLWEEDQ
ncbi:hypothetical protein BGX26_002658 [Mortierella sp. AD094]|nr:hypothetical protein BGX26_002658 [Mortierella sp. AD094]